MRLDKLVSERFGLSRAVGQGGHPARPGGRGGPDVPRPRPGGRAGCRARLRSQPAAARDRGPADRVLYQDRHILIVDKPAGLLTQPTQEREPDTLLERAGRYLARKRGGSRPYVGIVHRLDRDTSGVILLVCSRQALRPFQALFRAHTIERRYLTVVEGALTPTAGRSTCRSSPTAATAAAA